MSTFSNTEIVEHRTRGRKLLEINFHDFLIICCCESYIEVTQCLAGFFLVNGNTLIKKRKKIQTFLIAIRNSMFQPFHSQLDTLPSSIDL